MTRWFDKELQSVGFSSTQVALMLTIAVLNKPTYARAGREMAMEKSTLSRNLIVLEQEGLVRTAPVRGSRQKTVSLSAKGIRAIREAIPVWAGAQEAFVAQFGADRWPEFLDGLEATISNVHAVVDSEL